MEHSRNHPHEIRQRRHDRTIRIAIRSGEINSRDIVVIGASAGGLEALQHVLQNLGPDFPGSVFIVMHIGPGNRLTPVLERATPLPLSTAQDGEIITAGRILVAPPDHHLLLNGHRILLSRGPKQNGHRPAIDALFASAARNYGKRVVGVVLRGCGMMAAPVC